MPSIMLPSKCRSCWLDKSLATRNFGQRLLVRTLTFNHWVTGSNPVPLTIIRGHCDGQVNHTCYVAMTFFIGHVTITKGQVITVVWSSDYSA